MESKKILITGGGGYLGSVLTPLLLDKGYAITVLDRFFFGKETLGAVLHHPNLTTIEGDTRTYPENGLNGFDAVMDLAALSNDPLGELDPKLTLDINFNARVRNATLAKKAGVKKYILASSCSVYGCQDGQLTEQSPTRPLTTYAKASFLAEENILKLSSPNFSVTVLRQGTLYGISPRMRFDLVVNIMTLSLFKDGTISIVDGSQWRPLVHVEDSARAFVAAADAKQEKINGQIFNVGSTEHNFQVYKLAEDIINAINVPAHIKKINGNDERSYRVNCEKIKSSLNYTVQKNPRETSKEIYEALKNNTLTEHPKTITLQWYKHLLTQNPNLLAHPSVTRYV